MKAVLSALIFFPLVAACGGSGDDDSSSGSGGSGGSGSGGSGTMPVEATCASICAQQNKLCGTKDDCLGTCASLNDVAARSGCQSQYQEGLDCLAKKNVCDSAETACPATSFNDCLKVYCMTMPTDPVCTT